MLTPAPQSNAQSPPRVLVVDDSAVIRQAIEKMLKAEFEVVLAEDGEIGWDKLAHDERIQAMITDIEMPRLDGYAFICRVRAADEGRIRDIPIITITGAEDEETRLRAFACGATDFITKPLDSKQLQACLQAYMNVSAGSAADVGEAEGRMDPQTGLHTRRFFLQRGREDLSKAGGDGASLTLVRVDIDHLKRIYQKLGDEAMEPLLAWLAKLLRQHADDRALIARTGGGEFALLAPFASREDALAWCERVRADAEARALKIGRHTATVTLSMGLAVSDEGPQDIEALLALAERRLVRAKSEGGNRVSTTSLGDGLSGPEEVVLAPLAASDSGLGGFPIVEVEELPVGELEAFVQRELGAGTSSERSPLRALLSIDKAVDRLTRGEFDSVAPYLAQFVTQVLPLLAAYNEREALGLDAALSILRERARSQFNDD